MNLLTSAFPRPIDMQLSRWNVILDDYELSSRGIRIPFDYFIRNCNYHTIRLIVKNGIEMGDNAKVWNQIKMYAKANAREDISNWTSARFIFALLYSDSDVDLVKLDRFNRYMTEVTYDTESTKTLLNEALYIAQRAMN